MFSRFSRILLVDDSAVQRKIMRGVLATLGFENIDEAPNGRAALSYLTAHTYKLVVSDWEMEPVDGPELLRHMRNDARWKRLPFIMTTGQARKKFAEVARDDGITHYLAKPFTADDLADRLVRIRERAAA